MLNNIQMPRKLPQREALLLTLFANGVSNGDIIINDAVDTNTQIVAHESDELLKFADGCEAPSVELTTADNECVAVATFVSKEEGLNLNKTVASILLQNEGGDFVLIYLLDKAYPVDAVAEIEEQLGNKIDVPLPGHDGWKILRPYKMSAMAKREPKIVSTHTLQSLRDRFFGEDDPVEDQPTALALVAEEPTSVEE